MGHMYYKYVIREQKKAALAVENEVMRFYYEEAKKDIAKLSEAVMLLQEQDDSVYRVILGVAPLSSEVRRAGTGGSERYKDLLDYGIAEEELVVGVLDNIAQLKKQALIQERSYRDLYSLARSKESYYASVPCDSAYFE